MSNLRISEFFIKDDELSKIAKQIDDMVDFSHTQEIKLYKQAFEFFRDILKKPKHVKEFAYRTAVIKRIK